MMRRYCVVTAALLAALTLASCGKSDTSSESTTAVTTETDESVPADTSVSVSITESVVEDYSDRMLYESVPNVRLLVFRCGHTYMTLELGNKDARWIELYGNLPDRGKITDGGFGLVTADITRISGGVSGFIDVPRIDKLIDEEVFGLQEAAEYCRIRKYALDKTFYNEPLSCGEYTVIDLNGTYYVYRNGEAVGKYKNKSDAETAMGLKETVPDSHIKELRSIMLYLIRCGDKIIAFSHSPEMNSYWTPLLNPDFDAAMLRFTLDDGEAVMLRQADVTLMNGGDAGYVNAPLIMSFGEVYRVSGNSLTYFVIQPGELETIKTDDNARFVEKSEGAYLIFLVDGKFHVYLSRNGEKNECVGTFDTIEATAAAVRNDE